MAPIRSGTTIQSCLALVSLPASRVSSNQQHCAVVRIFAHINAAADAYAAQAAESFLRDRSPSTKERREQTGVRPAIRKQLR